MLLYISTLHISEGNILVFTSSLVTFHVKVSHTNLSAFCLINRSTAKLQMEQSPKIEQIYVTELFYFLSQSSHSLFDLSCNTLEGPDLEVWIH